MVIVTCPRTGHVRKFPNGRAAKRWLKEQAAVYVPTVEEDNLAFAGLSLQRNAQGEIVKARVVCAGFAGGNKEMAKGKSVKGALVRKQEGVTSRWHGEAKRETYGMVSHYTADRFVSVVDKTTGEKKTLRIKGGDPVIGHKVRFQE